MGVSVDYVARETASNLWRNRLMTVAAVLTVAVSLSLVGATLLLKQGVAQATEKWQQGVNVIVFMDAGASSPAVGAVGHELQALPYVKTCQFRSQTQDFQEARSLLPPDESQALTVSSTPSSFRCDLADPSEAVSVAQSFSPLPGVYQVTYPGQQIRTMETVIHVLQWVFLAVAVVLLLSASVLILNTIRMAIFARRREISVMKLVGATNWFIRIPFMCEGLVQGLLGALVAVLVVIGIHWGLDAAGSSTGSVLAGMRVATDEVAFTSLAVLVVGGVVGSLGSAFAIRRFLDV